MERICGSDWVISSKESKKKLIFVDEYIPILFEVISEVMKLRESQKCPDRPRTDPPVFTKEPVTKESAS